MKTAAGVEDADVRVAGEVPKPPNVGAVDNEVPGLKRAIPQNYEYDPTALKPLARMMWALSVALGHAMTAHRQFVKLKSATISPDGLIGGRGYVMSVKDIRKSLHDACEAISAVSDTIHDEIHAPHWKPRLAELEKNDIEDVERLVGDAERIMDDPEGTTSDDDPEQMEKAEESGPRVDLAEEESGGSEMPDGDDLADSRPDPSNMKQASAYTYRRGNSSLPVETLPGPRVDHLDRGDVDQTGPFGSYNNEEPISMDDSWSRNDGGRGQGEYDYESEWDNELLDKTAADEELELELRVVERFASSAIPDSNTDGTPTEGWDFGIGMGDGNDAHGQGAGGYGNVDSDGKGVYSPSSEMPDDPAGKLHDDETSDTTPMVELSVGQSSMPKHAADRWKVASMLPNDGEPPVARSDYYEGEKGNVVNSTTGLPGTQMPAKPTPVSQRPSHNSEHMFSTSELPQDPVVETEFAKDMQPGTGYRFERQNQPYIKWDTQTHNMRPDHVYQREVQGPYVKQEG